VFYGSASGLHSTPDDTLANDVTASRFGAALSYAGYMASDAYVRIVIGAPNYTNGQANEGAIYVYAGSANGLDTPPFTFESNEANARAGAAVGGGCDLNGDGFADIVLGEPGASPGGHPAAGRAIVLSGSSSGASSIVIATAEGAEDSLALGAGVAFAGDVDDDGGADVLVGTPGENGNGTRRGGFRCYRGTVVGFDPAPLFVIFGSTDQGRVGAALGTAGDLDGDGYADFAFADPFGFPGHTGVVNLFYGGIPGKAYGSFVGGLQANSRFGAAVATAGDVDGDGYSDLVVGAPDGGASLEGTAYLLLGRPAKPSIADNMPMLNDQESTDLGSSLAIMPTVSDGFFPSLLVGESAYGGAGSVRRYTGRLFGISNGYTRFPSATPGEAFGSQVRFAGDVNRDGSADFLVGAPIYSSGGITNRGRVYLYLGSGQNWTQSPWLAQGTLAGELFGVTVDAGDFNSDGYSDIAVGGWGYGTPLAGAGKASVYLGGPTGPGSVPSWTKTGTAMNEYFGYRVATLDFDADGYSDLAVAVVSNTEPRVDIFYGGPGGLSSNAAFSFKVVPLVPTYASEIANVGDFNCDGTDDLVVCAPDHGIWLYPGSRARSKPLDEMISFWKPAEPGTSAGASIAGHGDLDGDGRSDFVVGAPTAAHLEEQEGALYVFRGRPGNAALAPDTTYESNVAFRNLGYAIAPLADVSHDGFADIVASANGGDGGLYVWLGGGQGNYLSHLMIEAHFSGLRRFAPAVLDSATQYGFIQSLRSAAGRSRVSGQLEVRVQGTPFTGVPTYDYAYLSDTGPFSPLGSVSGLNAYVYGLFPRTSYHVRGRAYLNSPYFPHTRWVTPEGQANVYDFRTGGTVTGAPSTGEVAIARLGRIVPNPARGAARIAFDLPGRAPARLDVYDVRGRHVRTLLREAAESGARTWDGTDAHGSRVPPGLYFVELRVGDTVDRGRIVLMD
jgi:hypothetical protein